jgi:hypothetical protein
MTEMFHWFETDESGDIARTGLLLDDWAQTPVEIPDKIAATAHAIIR